MPRHRTPPRLATLIALTALSTLSLNMFLPSLANIATDLQADYALVSLAVALYLGIMAVVQLIVGPLSDRLGRRPVLLGALVVFVGASTVCALAEDVWTFLVFRMLQGGMIAGYAVSSAIVRDTTSERETASTLGYITMAMAVAPMLGPMLGGVLDAMLGWRATFWFYVTAGAVMLVICWADLGETNDRTRTARGDRASETRALLSTPRFWGFALCTAFSTGAFYTFLAGAPLVATASFDVSTATLGVFLGSITGGFMVGGFLSARLAKRYEITTLILAGRLVACGGLAAGIVVLSAGVMSPLSYFGSTIFVGLGNGLTMPGSNAGAMSVRPGLAGTAAGMNGALTVGIGAVLTSLAGVLVGGAHGPMVLLVLMFTVSFLGLLAALLARMSAAPAPEPAG